jgi:hypothetical protein
MAAKRAERAAAQNVQGMCRVYEWNGWACGMHGDGGGSGVGVVEEERDIGQARRGVEEKVVWPQVMKM